MKFDVYFHFVSPDLSQVTARLDSIQSLLAGLNAKVIRMSAQLDTLTQEVSEIGTVVDSAIVLINGLATQIAELKNDPAALQALADALDAKAAALAAAIAAGTPTP